jgi:hypothetical protein
VFIILSPPQCGDNLFMTDIFLESCRVSLILILWFKSNVFVEYASFLPKKMRERMLVDKFKTVTDYEFTDFLLKEKGGNFFIRLICCPLCLGFWLSAALTSNFCAAYIVSLLTFFVFEKASE